ncbi:alcohol dehydrogenase, iron-dependent domain protein [Carnobacterium maltaromaticum LMA28]|uniref:Alcohol dehydrogenase, iron-dependent domain protein n=2 Tax=Carnobacterium maltaromaticum TaxID=2751 RepID=K8E1X2_CARML|nr:alcohol dehydrogenase, iron-dependent domain protein [Carnobacterium maltaromaticum LMA28]
MPTTLSECGITKEVFTKEKHAIAVGALKDGCTATNPRIPKELEIEEILETMLV